MRPRRSDRRVDRQGYEGQTAAGLFGTPEYLIEKIREVQAIGNVGHLITLHSFGDMPRDRVEESMKLFGQSVLPTIKTFGTGEPEAIGFDVVRGARDGLPVAG